MVRDYRDGRFRRASCWCLLFGSCLFGTLPGYAGFYNASYPVGIAPISVAVGDFNARILDVVVASGNTVSVLLGSRDGSFSGPITALSDPSLHSVAVGDFDGDGITDIVTLDFFAMVKVYRGTSNGTFVGPVFSMKVGDGAYRGVLVRDFKGNGLPDIAVLSTISGYQSVFYNLTVLSNDTDLTGLKFTQHDYTLGFAAADPNFGEVRTIPDTLAAGYFLEGGRQAGVLDLAVTQTRTDANGHISGQITTIRHPAAENAQVIVSPEAIPPVGFSASAAGDFNGDGIDDLVVQSASGLIVRFGNGDGTFTYGTSTPGPFSSVINTHGNTLVVEDFNGDGKADIVILNDRGTISLLLGNGDGTFRDPVNYDTGLAPRSVAVGDLNGDGWPDLVVANFGDESVSVFINDTFWDRLAPVPFASP